MKIHLSGPNRSILLIALFIPLIILSGCRPESKKIPSSILAVFAHPDDEIYVAPLLSKYARLGAAVNLIIVTDGRYGPGESGLPVGQELVELRKEELSCAATTLGINEPISLGYHDQLKMQEGLGVHVHYARKLIRELDSLVLLLAPDILITWGPDGGTNHPDHRLVGVSLAHVFLSRKQGPKKLYFVGTPTAQLSKEDQLLHGVDKRFLTTHIEFDSTDLKNTAAALHCYRSQFSKARIEERIQKMNENEPVIYLRQLLISDRVNTHL